MTLDEAIKHLEEILSDESHEWSCESCKQEHEQLLEWLKELKVLKEKLQGDLISRSALLKAIEEERQYLLARGQTGAEHILVHHFLSLINDASPVETDTEVVVKDAYEQGYTDGWKERFGEPNERSEGEWVLTYCSCGDRYYTCSICNRTIEVKNGQSLKDYPFCHCGAKMKGNAE